MKAIIIDTSAERLVLIVMKNGLYHSYVGEPGARRHTSSVLIELEKLLMQAGVSPMEVNYVGVVVGPGSFTGIRIGVSTGNAIAYACGAQMVEITSLEDAAYGCQNVLALLDCKHNNFYALKRENGKDEYLALTGEEVEAVSLQKIYKENTDVDNLVRVMTDKIENEIISDKAIPFYIKKSSAEQL